jgi:hypothetical protein
VRGSIVVVAIAIAGCTGAADDGGAPRVRPGATGLAGPVIPSLVADSAAPVEVRWDEARGRPRLVTGAFAGGGAAGPEAVARAVLARHAQVFALDAQALVVRDVRPSLAGRYVRFGETAGGNGLPVFGGEVIALVEGDTVRAINLAHRGPIAAPAAAGDRGLDAALAALRAEVGGGPDRLPPAIERGVAIDDAGVPRLAYRITLATTAPRASWRAEVDAETGEVVHLRDLLVRATGSGFVFDPNAVDSTGDVTLDDGDNADTAALTAARFAVSLERLDESGFLRGMYADARGAGARAMDAGLVFDFTRGAREFEEVMAYYHIDRAQQRIQDLGIPDANARPQPLIVDGITADNSFYDDATGEIVFGTGGVDDAEDADIIVHEYGHAIQHNIVLGWGDGGDASAMGEGFSDYLGGGFETTLAAAAGRPGLIDPACVGEWDATSYTNENPPCLRRLDVVKHWPERAAGQSHADGEVWSGALWAARTAIGADVVDAIVLEHHFLLSSSETFDSAAQALVATDQSVNGGANTVPLRRALFHRGVLRVPVAPADAPDVIEQMPVSIEHPRINGNYANRVDDTQVATFPGATAVRVHFTMIDTETDNAPTCIGGCDNIYLTDPSGDLYQILYGAMTDVTSVVVPGDTIHVRLVTDLSVQGMGYHIDRIDSMGNGPPPGPDAGGGDDGGDGGGGCCQGSPQGSIPIALVALALVLRRRS